MNIGFWGNNTVTGLFFGLCILTAIYLWQEGKKLTSFEKIINTAMLWLVVGIPLLFSPLTRSVFEVWKMLLMRLVLIVAFTAWFTKKLIVTSPSAERLPLAERFSLLGLVAWKKTGLEWPFIIWGIINILATIFAQNFYVAIIGSYDRWEGLITAFNYIFVFFLIAKMIKKESILHWILLAIFGSTALSAVYAILQSAGIDFMNWSADPTARTFACINNPVHYSAYIAMVVPLGLGWLLYQSADKKDNFFTGWLEPRRFYLALAVFTTLVFAIIFISGFFGTDIIILPGYLVLLASIILVVFLFLNGLLNNLAPKTYFLKLYTFISLLIIYYSMYISYGRGTWMGFAMSMVIFFWLLLGVINVRNRQLMIADVFVSIGVIGIYFVNFAFNLYKKGPMIVIPAAIIFGIYLMFTYWLECRNRHPQQDLQEIVASSLPLAFLVSIASLLSLVPAWLAKAGLSSSLTILSWEISYPLLIYLIIGAGIIAYAGFLAKADSAWRAVLLRHIILWLFLTLPFISVNFKQIFIYFGLIGVLYFFNRMQVQAMETSPMLNEERRHWLFAFLLIFGLVLILPTLPGQVQRLVKAGEDMSRTGRNVEIKIEQLERQALMGSARISMWKTSLGWAGIPYPYFGEKDGEYRWALHATAWVDGPAFAQKLPVYPLLGTGPDTVKDMYTIYRRPDYGRLEGGHNLTPDRVHNEYLNVLITTGILGFIANYFLIMGTFIIIVLTALKRYEDNPYFYLIGGALAGVFIYQGQVLFNFGVVATKVLFYVLMGFAIAISTHNIGLQVKENNNGQQMELTNGDK